MKELTPRQKQIAKLINKGMRNAEIGEKLGITEGTVKSQVYKMFKKLKIDRRSLVARRTY